MERDAQNYCHISQYAPSENGTIVTDTNLTAQYAPWCCLDLIKYGSRQVGSDDQGPRIVGRLGWGVENSDSKCAVRVENSVLK